MAQGNPHPNQQGLRRPWRKGEYPGSRISNAVARAVKLARQHCPEAIKFAAQVMNDAREEPDLRLKAADLILKHGMPRGDNSKYLGEETIGSITLRLVMPGEIEDKPVIDAQPLRLDTETVGSGD